MRAACYRAPVKIAVVIPALDEADEIERALASVSDAAQADPGKDPGEDSGKDPRKELGKELGKEPGKEPTRDSAKEPGQQEEEAGEDEAREEISEEISEESRVQGRAEGRLRGRAEGRDPARRVDEPIEVERVVVDGGSRDGTPERARAVGATVLETGPGRARQLQAGVDASKGEVVLFLHADTRLPSGWRRAVREALQDPSVAGGAFRLRFDDRRASIRLLEWGARLRAEWLGLPYGDQALFVRRSLLESIGGVPDAPVMEDLDLVRAIRAHGRLALLPLPATTSARRHLEGGVWATAAQHMLALAAWRLGVDRERVARWLGR